MDTGTVISCIGHDDDIECFVVDIDQENLPEWVRRFFWNKKERVLFMCSGVPSNLNKIFIDYLKREKINFILSEDKHTYIPSDDLVDLIPERAEHTKNAEQRVMEGILSDEKESGSIH